MKYTNNNKTYEVDSVVYKGAIINVNGRSITDCDKLMGSVGYEVTEGGDELFFETFEEAYAFATK